MMQLGQRIQHIRRANNLTQEEFAKIFNVTRQTVSNWENEKSYPDLFTLIKISDSFNISLDKLLKEDIKMTKKLNGEIKWAKRAKIVIGAILLLVLVIMSVWFFIWNHNKTVSEEKFQEGLSKYEYSIDKSGHKGGYYIIPYDENTYFTLPNQSMPGYFDFATDFHAKDVDCYIEKNGEIVELCWALYDGEVDGTEKIMINKDDNTSSKMSASDIDTYAEIIEFGTGLYNDVYR